MTKSEFNLRKVLILITFLVVIFTSAYGQRRKCPLESYDGCWAFGTTETFYVGDPFDGIGQVEVMRPGKQAQFYEKNRKWTIGGDPIKPGQVFTTAGKFVMTIESNGYKTAYNVEVLPVKGPARPVARVETYPIQTEYKVGDHFYVDGIKIVCHDANGKEVPVEGKDITFFTSISNTLVGAGYQCGGGYKFSTPGKKVIEVRYKYVTIGKYTINVEERKSTTGTEKNKSAADNRKPATENKKSTTENKKSPTVIAKTMVNGWYNLRAMNNYLNLDPKESAELRKKTVNQVFYVENKGKNQVTMKMSNGKYLGISGTIKDGARVKAVSTPFLWNTYSENNADIFSLRPSTNIKMVVNASEEKNVDGTNIIVWTYTDLNAPNNAEFRFIPTKSPK